jgi:hypothetical protein
MSDATVRFPARVSEGVAAYVREVRIELADLPAEEVDDLTSGMDADLSELAAESGGDLIGRLGTPALYAAELRAAAGLPPRVAGSAPRRRPLTQALTRSRDNARASFAMLTVQHPWLRSVTAFLMTLRPAWWLARGYLAAWALWSLLGGGARGVRPHGFLHLAMALAAIVVSVQVGRGWLRHKGVLRPMLFVANITLVITALVASVSSDVQYDYNSGYIPPAGVSLDGEQVANIYAYDSGGRRLSNVRLFAANGRPLVGGDLTQDIDQNGNPIGAVHDSSGAPVTNVYPRVLFGQDPWQVLDPADPQRSPAWTPPMSIVPLTSGVMPTSGATPTSAAAPTPTVSPTGTISPTPPGTATAPVPTVHKPAPDGTARSTQSSGSSPSVTRSGR